MLFTWSRYLCRRRPTLPHTFACSTIGPAGLDFRVRYGNGYFPRGKITGVFDVGPCGPLGPRRGLHAEPVTSMSKELLAIGLGQEQIPRRAKALLGMTTLKESGRRDAEASLYLISHN